MNRPLKTTQGADESISKAHVWKMVVSLLKLNLCVFVLEPLPALSFLGSPQSFGRQVKVRRTNDDKFVVVSRVDQKIDGHDNTQ